MTTKTQLPAGITITKMFGRKTRGHNKGYASVYVYPNAQGKSRLCVTRLAAQALGIENRDVVAIAALSDGRFALVKDENGDTLVHQGRSSTLTSTFSVSCLECEAIIENGVAFFPEGAFFEIES